MYIDICHVYIYIYTWHMIDRSKWGAPASGNHHLQSTHSASFANGASLEINGSSTFWVESILERTFITCSLWYHTILHIHVRIRTHTYTYIIIYTHIYLSIYLSIYPSIHPFIHPSISIYPPMNPPMYLIIYLSIYLSIYKSISIYLSTSGYYP